MRKQTFTENDLHFSSSCYEGLLKIQPINAKISADPRVHPRKLQQNFTPLVLGTLQTAHLPRGCPNLHTQCLCCFGDKY